MAYTKATRNIQTTQPRTVNGSGTADVQLSIGTSDGDYLCQSVKGYAEKSSIVQNLGTAIIKISTFDKDLGALTVQNAKLIVIKNLSNICAEIFITVHDWKDDSGTNTDVYNSRIIFF